MICTIVRLAVLLCVGGAGCIPAANSSGLLETGLANTIEALDIRSATLAAGETALAKPSPMLPFPIPIRPPTPDPTTQELEQVDLPPGSTSVGLGRFQVVLLSPSLKGLTILYQFAFRGCIPTQVIVGGCS
jgi:hypothetical protein